jgi:Skp family chaperone for outer membrane proteins
MKALFGAFVVLGVAAQDKPAVRIGVVKLGVCFDPAHSIAARDLKQALDDSAAVLERELADLDRETRIRDSKLKDVDPGTPLHRKLRNERALLAATQRARQEVGKVELAELANRSRADLHERICRAAAEVARAENLDLILRDEGPAASILYFADRLDVTERVVRKLDERWTADRKNP